MVRIDFRCKCFEVNRIINLTALNFQFELEF